MRKFLWITFLVPAMLVMVPAESAAQERSGFWFSGGLGWASFGCEGCEGREGGVSGSLSLGTSLSQQLLVGVSSNAWTKSEEGARLTAGTLTATARYYPSATNGLHVAGGLGLGMLEVGVSGFGSARETGLGAVVGVGYDIRMMPNVSVTPYWNGIGMRIAEGNSNFAQFGIGVTFH